MTRRPIVVALAAALAAFATPSFARQSDDVGNQWDLYGRRSVTPASLITIEHNGRRYTGHAFITLKKVKRAVAKKKLKRKAVKRKTNLKPIAAPANNSSLVAIARQYMGTNPTGWARLWCGRFMALVAPEAAAKIPNPNWARNWARLPNRTT